MLFDLPPELVELTLLRLPLPDLVHLTSVSSSLHDLIHNSHSIWSHHLRTRDLLVAGDEARPHNLNTFKERYCWAVLLDEYLERLSHEQIYTTLIEIDPEVEEVVRCFESPARRELSYRHLTNIVLSPNKFTALTSKLYGHHLLVALTQAGILKDLHDILSTSSCSVFHGSVLISRWVGACLFEPSAIHSVKTKDCIPVQETIDTIVSQCASRLTPTSTTEVVLRTINTVLYDDFGLKKNSENYYDFENNRIDKVLYKKTGIPITIAILYHEIGTRLGLSLNLINFPRHFLLSFEDVNGTIKYIDCFNEGDILSRAQCLQMCPMFDIADKDNYFQSTSVDQVLARLVRNVIAFGQIVPSHYDRGFFALNLYKIMSFLSPEDYDSAVHAMNFSLDFRIKCEFLRRFTCIESDIWGKYCRRMEQNTKSLKEHLSIKTAQPAHVKFKIGTVMLHKRYNYTCVIYGWDDMCMMSASWQERMGIAQLEDKGDQPYYKVLADDESERYVAQENLLESRSVFIIHREVGKYFSLYDGERFVPNSALRSIYTYMNK